MPLTPAVLAAQPLFSELTAAQLEVLAPLFGELSFAPEAQIFGQGELATWVYVLRTGQVDLCLRPEDGGFFCIAQVAPNGVFGWSAVLGRKRYTSTAVSVTAGQALVVKGYALRKLLHTNAALGHLVLDRMARTVVGRASPRPTQMARLIEQEMTLLWP